MVLEKHYSGPPKAAWFYLRDEYYAESVPKAEREHYVAESGVHAER
jgi:hypothetical protein